MVDSAGEAASDAYDATAEAAGDAYDATAKAAEDAYDTTAKAAKDAYDATAEMAEDAAEATEEMVDDAKDKLEVLAAVGELSGDLREELGDDSLDREKLRISETFTAKSLEAAQAYSKAQSLQYNGRYEESVEFYREAIAEDEHFGRAYSGLALSLGSLGRDDEADATWKLALQNLG